MIIHLPRIKYQIMYKVKPLKKSSVKLIYEPQKDVYLLCALGRRQQSPVLFRSIKDVVAVFPLDMYRVEIVDTIDLSTERYIFYLQESLFDDELPF